MIKLFAIDVFKLLNVNKTFNASSGWCTNFKNKFYLSTVRYSIIKKLTTVYTETELNDFTNLCIEKYKL